MNNQATGNTPTDVAQQVLDASGKIIAILSDANGLTALITGAVSLIVKLKQTLTHNHADLTVDIQNLDADAQTANAAEISEANAWLVARGYPPFNG